jgi:hypothetical protein
MGREPFRFKITGAFKVRVGYEATALRMTRRDIEHKPGKLEKELISAANGPKIA